MEKHRKYGANLEVSIEHFLSVGLHLSSRIGCLVTMLAGISQISDFVSSNYLCVNWQVDIPVKYLSFFLDDDAELEEIKKVGSSVLS